VACEAIVSASHGLPKLAVRLHGGLPARQCVADAVAAEAAGFAAVWFAENPFNRGILPAASACAVATTTVEIGAGVFNPFNRHPSLIAMEIGALDELAGGRARLGIGSGIGSAVERMGFSYARPLTAVAEAIAIVRALLRGEEVTRAGKVFTVERLKLDYAPRPDIAIFMAGRGDNSLRLAGEVADGVLLSNMCTLGFATHAAGLAREAARAAGRAGLPGVVQYMPCCPRPDRDDAMRAAKAAIGEMLPVYWALGGRLAAAKDAMLRGSAIDEAEFATAAQRLRAGEDAGQVLDDRFVSAFCIAGTAAECRAQLAACAAAGITEVALTFSGSTAAADMDYLGAGLTSAPSRFGDTL
jgi:5,10-methylenetetrahydromethanopterin reductase